MNNETVRIIIAEDHKIVRTGLRLILQQEPSMKVVAEAENGREVIDLVRKLGPDIVVMDITMPDMNGIEATRQILAVTPQVKVIILSMHSDRKFIAEALKAGAHAYLLKDCASDELMLAIKAVIANKSYLSPAIASVVVKGYLHHNHMPLDSSESLSPREREVLYLIAEGKTTKEIASILYLSTKTVETHRQRIMGKLKINNIAELVKYAIREGVIHLET